MAHYLGEVCHIAGLLYPVDGACSIVRGGVHFGQIGPGIIIDAVFVVGLLGLYPYRASRPGQ
jgi:hypothetical protein